MASKNISFSSIPGGIKKPGIYIEQDISQANRTLPSTARKMLIIAQRLAAGNIAELVPYQPFSEADVIAASGFGSMAHLMYRTAAKMNPNADITIITLADNGAGTAAAGTFTITGPATSAGSIRIYIGDQYVDVPIASGNSATDVAVAIKNAINLKTDLPVTSGNVAGVNTVTALHKGLCGNDIGLGYALTGAAGITCAIVAMSNGATNPVLQNALNVVAGTRYHVIVTPFNNQTDLGTLKTHISTLSGPLEKKFCRGIYAMTGALATATTLGGQVNYQRIDWVYVRDTAATQQQLISWQLAAGIAAGLIADPDPAGPVKNMDVSAIVSNPAIADRLTRQEQETVLAGGGGPIEVGPGEATRLVRLPTSYILDANNAPVFIDVHQIVGMDYVADAAISDISAKMPKKIIKEGSPTAKQILTNIVLDTAYKCQEAGVLTGVTDYKDQFLVEEDLQNVGQMDIMMPSPVVKGSYVVAVKQVLY
jgi:phage tail sheath gpL-like